MTTVKVESTRIKFNSKHIDSLLHGNKCITVRPETWEGLEEGDEVELIDDNEETFGTAEIDSIKFMALKEFVDYRLDGHETYDDALAFAEELSSYYPDREVVTNDTVYVIWMRNITPQDD